MLCIGLSYHNAHEAYDAYESALLRRAGALGLPVDISWLAGKNRPVRPDLISRLDGICFTGGDDVDPQRYGREDAASLCRVDTERDRIEFALAEQSAARNIPTLGICRGAQLLNVFHGGTLTPDLGERNPAHRGQSFLEHSVSIADGTLLKSIAGARSEIANSSHHQAVEQVAPGFRISAYAEDGVVEALERAHTGSAPFFLAVQWHPERMSPGMLLADAVLDAFLRAASFTAHA